MSVLYKALQKAEKENELRQSASPDANFDPQRLAASGALKLAGGRGRSANRIALAVIVLLAVAGSGAALFLLPAPPQTQVAAVSPPPVPPASAEPVLQPPPAVSPAEGSPAASPATVPGASAEAAANTPASAGAVAAAPPADQPQSLVPPATEASAPTSTAATGVSGGDETAAVPGKPAEAKVASAAVSKPAPRSVAPPAPEPMPRLAADSPARMLNPPIAINRAGYALAGIGSQVQVREVSQAARSNVRNGYEALIGGSYANALSFYEKALEDEPNSVLALLGRGAALQKLGRSQDAQASYDSALKIDPQNREALTNLTSIVGERSPQEALGQLLELEREYAGFSPIKAQIGLIYAKTGSMDRALEYLRRAAELSPEAVMYHYNLALVLDHLGRREQAVTRYETVLAAISAGRGPADLSAGEIERRVRFLRAR